MRFAIVLCVLLGSSQESEDEPMSIYSSAYYDPASKLPLRITSIENVLVNFNYSTKSVLNRRPGKIFRKIGYSTRSNGCSCHGTTCGCCLGINLNQFNFQREGCMNFSYIPEDFGVAVNMYMNGDTIFSQSVSGRNPPPACLPIPIPYVPIQVHACAKLFNVFTVGSNIHLCFDFETHLQGATVLILHFDCMRLGTDGVALLKPEDGGGLTTPSPNPVDVEEPDDIYDEVTEIKYVKKGEGASKNGSQTTDQMAETNNKRNGTKSK